MYIYLDIVEQFSCEMCGVCCRNDWQVTVDETSYRRNQEYFAVAERQQEFAQAFIPLCADTMPGEHAYIAKNPAGGCWFLEPANTCWLHREAGHSQLDAVCQTYPRYPMTTARGIELTLSFSCPAVLRLAESRESLQVVRSDSPPLDFLPDTYVEQVFPKQKRLDDPLRYYFEIEQHWLDILQCRKLPLAGRLELISRTAKLLAGLNDSMSMGAECNRIFYANYGLMDDMAEAEQPSPAERLTEHFFVNFIFKKPLYRYGLLQTSKWLHLFHQHIQAAVAAAQPDEELTTVRQAIMYLEFLYGHNRKALLV